MADSQYDNTVPVQSCITSVSYPSSLETLEQMFTKHGARDLDNGYRALVPAEELGFEPNTELTGADGYSDQYLTDMDGLLNADNKEEFCWTAAKWMRPGDVLFFYHTAKARKLTRSCYKQALHAYGKNDPRIEAILRSIEIADRYAGTIFGCGLVIAEVENSGNTEGHFKSQTFAPFTSFSLFPTPLPASAFKDFVKISQNTITPLSGPQFTGIKSLLSANSTLPAYLSQAIATQHSFSQINRENWATIACSPEIRFRDEGQLREYFLDYFLAELKDPRSSLLLECECYRDSKSTGFADYMIQINNQWLPVEAKLSISASPKILDQVIKYQNIQKFTPTLGPNRSKDYSTNPQTGCLIADQTGIYFARGNQFIGCSPGNPIWKRESIYSDVATQIRQWLIENGLRDG
jgi:hypothetical protein